MIGIIDYGAGNLRSVKKALDYLEIKNRIIRSADEFNGVEKIILPGVGAFQAAIEGLLDRGIFDKTAEWLQEDRPFLGICLGLEVLFESSEESPGIKGFGILKGDVARFRHHKVPQIGWNQVLFKQKSVLIEGIKKDTFFYFLHGYYVIPENLDIVVGTTEYAIQFPSIIQKGNIFAVQFHPEKSAEAGLKLLKNWTTAYV